MRVLSFRLLELGRQKALQDTRAHVSSRHYRTMVAKPRRGLSMSPQERISSPAIGVQPS